VGYGNDGGADAVACAGGSDATEGNVGGDDQGSWAEYGDGGDHPGAFAGGGGGGVDPYCVGYGEDAGACVGGGGGTEGG